MQLAQKENSHHHHGHSEEGKHHEHKKGEERFLFSPNEIGIVGRSGAGKTTLITALIEKLSPQHKIAYLKHDAPEVTMHHEGEDTRRAASSGASAVFIGHDDRFALLGGDGLDQWNAFDLWNDVDIVLVEGHRRSRLPKVVVVDHDGEILEEVDELVNVVAYVLRDDTPPKVREETRRRAGELPLFELRAQEAIADFLLTFLENRARSAPLYGLILGGGKSTRMKRDKAAIEYRGTPQVRYAYSLLAQFCERVFVSNRTDQASDPVFDGLEQIHDRFLDIGPMGGILSAFHTHPKAAWLVVGCDLPFVDEPTLSDLVRQRDPLMLATCYVSAHDGLPEPLCALYEPRYRRRLHQFLADGRDCPRKALINSRAKLITLTNPAALDNINYPEEYERAVRQIRAEVVRGS